VFDLAEELDVLERALEHAVEAGLVTVDQGEFGATGEFGEDTGEADDEIFLGAFCGGLVEQAGLNGQEAALAASSSTRPISMPSVGLILSMYCWCRSAKTSFDSSSRTRLSARRPCRVELAEARSLPTDVTGPWDSFPLAREAMARLESFFIGVFA
jgi:hypothetical protein